jgi:hypothetical protein
MRQLEGTSPFSKLVSGGVSLVFQLFQKNTPYKNANTSILPKVKGGGDGKSRNFRNFGSLLLDRRCGDWQT